MSEEKLYPAGIYMRVVGLSSPRYCTWLAEYTIKPVIEPKGSGTRALWSKENMVLGLGIKTLADAGLKVNDAEELASKALADTSTKAVEITIANGVSITINTHILEESVKYRLLNHDV